MNVSALHGVSQSTGLHYHSIPYSMGMEHGYYYLHFKEEESEALRLNALSSYIGSGKPGNRTYISILNITEKKSSIHSR